MTTQAQAAAPPRAMQGDRAGFITRMSAAVINLVVVIGAWFTIIGTFAVVRFMFRPRLGVRLPNLPSWAHVVGMALIAIAMASLFWATTGRSIGEVVLGLRVVRQSGAKLGFARALIRATHPARLRT